MKDRNIGLWVVVGFVVLGFISMWLCLSSKISLNNMRLAGVIDKLAESIPKAKSVPAKAIVLSDKDGNPVSRYVLIPEMVNTGKYMKAGDKQIAIHTLGYAQISIEKKAVRPMPGPDGSFNIETGVVTPAPEVVNEKE